MGAPAALCRVKELRSGGIIEYVVLFFFLKRAIIMRDYYPKEPKTVNTNSKNL